MCSTSSFSVYDVISNPCYFVWSVLDHLMCPASLWNSMMEVVSSAKPNGAIFHWNFPRCVMNALFLQCLETVLVHEMLQCSQVWSRSICHRVWWTFCWYTIVGKVHWCLVLLFPCLLCHTSKSLQVAPGSISCNCNINVIWYPLETVFGVFLGWSLIPFWVWWWQGVPMCSSFSGSCQLLRVSW